MMEMEIHSRFFYILVDFCHYQPMWSVLFVEARSLDTCYRNQQTLMLGTECFQESTLLFDPQNYMYLPSQHFSYNNKK